MRRLKSLFILMFVLRPRARRDEVSHFLMMERPKEFNELVRAFVAKHKLL